MSGTEMKNFTKQLHNMLHPTKRDTVGLMFYIKDNTNDL